MLLYALVSSDSDMAIDLFLSLEQAEGALRDVLADEPGFAELLKLVPVDFDELARSGPSWLRVN